MSAFAMAMALSIGVLLLSVATGLNAIELRRQGRELERLGRKVERIDEFLGRCIESGRKSSAAVLGFAIAQNTTNKIIRDALASQEPVNRG